MQTEAETIEEYLAGLPEDRFKIVSEVRKIILRNLHGGYEEIMQNGLISYIIPLSVFPNPYEEQPITYVSLDSQKDYVCICLEILDHDSNLLEWIEGEFENEGKELNIKENCIQFNRIDQLPLNVIGRVIASYTAEQYIRLYEGSI